MKLHMESVKHGTIGEKKYAALYTELPDGKYLAVIAVTDPAEIDSGGTITKTCSTKEEALAAVEEAWVDLERSALLRSEQDADRDIVYEILKIFESGREPRKEDIGADKETFHEWMEQIHDDSLVENIAFSRDGRGNIRVVFANNCELTKYGREYIESKEAGKI